MTEAIWDKNAIRVKLVKKDGSTCQRSFNNVVQGATPDQLHQFGQLVATLTGEQLKEVYVMTTSHTN